MTHNDLLPLLHSINKYLLIEQDHLLQAQQSISCKIMNIEYVLEITIFEKEESR